MGQSLQCGFLCAQIALLFQTAAYAEGTAAPRPAAFYAVQLGSGESLCGESSDVGNGPSFQLKLESGETRVILRDSTSMVRLQKVLDCKSRTPEPPPAQTRQATDDETSSTKAPVPMGTERSRGTGLLIGGGILLPLGIAATTGWLYFYITSELYEGGGSHGGGPIAGAVFFVPALVGLAGVGGGIAMLAVGAARRNRANSGQISARVGGPHFSFVPYANSSAAGLYAVGSF